MGTPTVPDDATDEEKSEELGRDYEDLEDRIFSLEREEDEARADPSLELWQQHIVDRIDSEYSAGYPKILQAAYIEGLKIIRDEVHDDIRDILKMKTSIGTFVDDCVGNGKYASDILEMAYGSKIKDPIKGDREISEQQYVPIPKSISSEVENNYFTHCMLGKWFHRSIIAFGLSRSEFAGERSVKKAEKEKEMIVGLVVERRNVVEEALVRYLDYNTTYWINNGVDESVVEEIEELVGRMETDKRNNASDSLEVIKEFSQ